MTNIKMIEFIPDNKFGGISRRAILTTQELVKLGIDITVWTPDERGDVISRCASKSIYAESVYFLRPSLKSLKKTLIWIIILPVLIPYLAVRLHRSKCDAVHINGFISLPMAIAAVVARKKIIWHLANTVYPKHLCRPVLRLLGPFCTFLSISKEVDNHFLSNLPPKNRFILKEPIGHDNSVTIDTDSINFESNDFNVITIANISILKRIDRVLNIALESERRYDNIKYHIIGDYMPSSDHLRSEFKDFIKSHSLENRVIFHGPKSNIDGILQKSDLLLVTSSHEGTPMVILEAMLNSIPVVSTSVGGIPDIILSGTTGLLVEHADDPECYLKNIDAIRKDQRLRAKIVKKARNYVAEEHSIRKYTQTFLWHLKN